MRHALQLGGTVAAWLSAAADLASLSGAAALTFGGTRALSLAADTEQSLARGPPAFLFDIDGVLVRGRHTLPQAQRCALRVGPCCTACACTLGALGWLATIRWRPDPLMPL